MICAALEAVFSGVVEIGAEARVCFCGSFGRFYENEAQRTVVYACELQLFPVYLTLIAADVYAAYLISAGIIRVAKEGAPAKTCRADKEIIEPPHIKCNDYTDAYNTFKRNARTPKAILMMELISGVSCVSLFHC